MVVGQLTRARSLTIRRLRVRAWSRSIASVTSLGGSSVDHRLPTRRISPRRSRSCSRNRAFWLLRPAARATTAVENEPGISRSAARRRSAPGSVIALPASGSGGVRVSTAALAASDCVTGLWTTGGSSPNRARQAPHSTIGAPSVERMTSNRRDPRPERQIAQRRPARSISLMSSLRVGITYSP